MNLRALVRGDSPRRPLSEPESDTCEDEFAGLERLDRDELDEE